MLLIEISEETNERLLEYVRQLGEPADVVLNRVLDVAERQSGDGLRLKLKKARPADGELLPESDYWVPILEILAEAKGRAKGREVIDALEERLGSRFGPADHDVLAMGEVRWRNRARFARLRMKELGLVSSQSPRGIWEITEKGRDFLRAERDQVD